MHLLCTGGNPEIDRVVRQDGAEQVEMPWPRVVKDFYAFMGCVDVHDQLRRALRFQK